MTQHTTRLTVSIPAGLRDAIIAEADSRGVKRSTVVGEILAAHFGIAFNPVPPGRPWPKTITPVEKT